MHTKPATSETEIEDSDQQVPLQQPTAKRPGEPETDLQHVRHETIDRDRRSRGASVGRGAGATDTTSTFPIPSEGRVQPDRKAGPAAASGGLCVFRPPRVVAPVRVNSATTGVLPLYHLRNPPTASAVAAAVAPTEVPAELDAASDDLGLPLELPCRAQVAGGQRAEVPVLASAPDEAVNAGGEAAPPQEKRDEKNGEHCAEPVGAADCRFVTAVPESTKPATPGSKGRSSVQEFPEGYPAAAASAEVMALGVADGRYMTVGATGAAAEARARGLEQQLVAEKRDRQVGCIREHGEF